MSTNPPRAVNTYKEKDVFDLVFTKDMEVFVVKDVVVLGVLINGKVHMVLRDDVVSYSDDGEYNPLYVYKIDRSANKAYGVYSTTNTEVTIDLGQIPPEEIDQAEKIIREHGLFMVE